jgi:hypothetical protein
MNRIEDTAREIIEQIETETVPELAGVTENAAECRLCDAASFAVETKLATVEAERYSLSCPRCSEAFDGRLVSVLVPDDTVAIANEVRKPDECPECGTPHLGLEDLMINTGPIERSVQKRFVKGIQTNDIHNHHVSYKENETIPLCSSCHAKVHNTPGFADELQPELSRSEAAGWSA